MAFTTSRAKNVSHFWFEWMPLAHSLSVTIPEDPIGITMIIGLIWFLASSVSSTTPTRMVRTKPAGSPGKPCSRYSTG
jgi:hypothetical protein